MITSARLYQVAASSLTHPAPHAGALEFGITRGEFLEHYFEQRWLLRRAALKNVPMTWNDVDELLYRLDPASTLLKVFHDGEVPIDHYVDVVREHGSRHRLNKAAFYDYLARGATLVLNRVEEQSLAAKRLCAEISRFAGFPASGNAYLSFGGTGTFGKHWDTHDVFVLQLIGKKRWRVFEPTRPLPLSHQTSEGHEHECPIEPVLDIELSAGDVLYLPRGWWHQAIPKETGSFHLSVGTYPPTTMEYLGWLNEARLTAQADMRASVGQTKATAIARSVADLVKAVEDPHTLAAYRHSLVQRERTRSEFSLGLLLDSQKAELHGDIRVGLNSCYLHADNIDGVVAAGSLPVNGTTLQLDALRKTTIRMLAGVGTATMRDVYSALAAFPRTAICSALLDLARHDVVNLWRDRALP